MQDHTDDSANNQSTPDSHAAQDTHTTTQASCELLLMQRGARTFGVFAGEADGIAEWRMPAPLPRAPQAVLGVVSLRGRMLTLLDPLALLDERTATQNQTPRFIVALRGDEQLALAVDHVEGVSKFSIDEIETAGKPENQDILHGIVQRPTESIAVLDLNEIFATAMHGTDRRRRRS